MSQGRVASSSRRAPSQRSLSTPSRGVAASAGSESHKPAGLVVAQPREDVDSYGQRHLVLAAVVP